MSLIKNLHKCLCACALLAQAAGATTVIQSSGNSDASLPLGYYAPYASYGMTPIVYAVGWTETSDYTDLDVFANLFTVGSPGTVDYELVTALGPGTSFAADGIAGGTVSTPTNPADVSLFQLSFLQAGTYYLVLSSNVADTAWQYNYPIQSNNTMDTGVEYLGGQWSYGSSIDTSYTPGSSFTGVGYPVEFSVQGTVVTPEPATFAVAGIGLVGLSMALRAIRTQQ